MTKKTKGGHTRKFHRNLKKCADYRAKHTREKNKIRKIMKYLKSNPNDINALNLLEIYRRKING